MLVAGERRPTTSQIESRETASTTIRPADLTNQSQVSMRASDRPHTCLASGTPVAGDTTAMHASVHNTLDVLLGEEDGEAKLEPEGLMLTGMLNR